MSNKYGAIRTEIDGYIFDSRAEARRYQELALLVKAGEIRELAVHPRYPLVVNGVKVCTYEADFSYVERGRVVEDVKSSATTRLPVFRMKKALMLALYGITVREVLT